MCIAFGKVVCIMKRINITLSDELLPLIDEKAKQLHVSRSAYIAVCVTRQMQMDEMATQLPNMIELMNYFKTVGLENINNKNEKSN